MNVLYICHRFPFPPKRGGKIRPFNMIKALHEDGNKVWVASLVRDDNEEREVCGIEKFCHEYFVAKVDNRLQTLRMIARLPFITPSSMVFFYSKELKRHIEIILLSVSFDVIFVHCSSVAQYVSHVDHIPKILDFGDMDSQKWLLYSKFKPFPLSMGYWLEGKKMELEEKRLAKKFQLCTATTKLEWDTLNDYQTGIDSDWFPNGVDADYFKPDSEGYDEHSISFIGRMDYFPNQECMLMFCEYVLPLIKEKISDVKLYIVGADPSNEIKNLSLIEGVTVTGSVDDVRPYILRTAAMVAPLNIARGTQNKILESMAMGVPVVCSPMAAKGIDAVNGEHILTAETPAGYAGHLLDIMMNASRRAKLSKISRERILTHHDWNSSMNKMCSIVKKCLFNYHKSSTRSMELSK